MGVSIATTLVAVAGLVAGSLSCAAQEGLTLVQDGEARARIVVAADASGQVREAAQTLAGYVERASGAALPVVADEQADAFEGVSIEVGATALSDTSGLLPAQMDEDGFVTRAEGRSIIILGPSDWGTEFGVYDFLERFVGVRWLLPGPDGEDVPQAATLVVPAGVIEDEPVFFSRLFSGLRGGVQARWARFNRMHGRVSFHHNLRNLFPWEKYTETHPEFYPIIGGERLIPQREEGWQPCFTAPGIVEEAVKNIVEFFDRNPGATSYSLGMNDNRNFCQCESCMEHISGELNYLGIPDLSDLYYGWCNEVIEGVLEHHPDKWFGCLAYFNVAQPPRNVQVHPRLVPYITYDRMMWLDPERAAAGHEVTREWARACPAFGWYDYIYGSPYALPRMYLRHTAEYLRFGAENGVKTHYAEIYPNWGEGPKPYIYLKLWWNPHRDVEALLDEWYERTVGPDAAPYLKAYYDLWERFWTEEVPRGDWFAAGRTWLGFNNPAYLSQVNRADVHESRRLLEEALRRTETPAQRARAQLLMDAFGYYEASALAYLGHHEMLRAAPMTEEEALGVLDRAVETLTYAETRRRLALEVYPDHPVLVHPLTVERYGLMGGADWGSTGLWAVASFVGEGDNVVRRRVEALSRTAEQPAVRRACAAMLTVLDELDNLVSANPSFEEGEGEGSAVWWYWRKPDVPPEQPIGRMLRSQDVARTGEWSLLCDAMQRGGPVQTLDNPGPGEYAVVGWMYVPEGQESRGTVQLSLTLLDAQGGNLQTLSASAAPAAGRWTPLAFTTDLPQAVGERPVARLRLIPIVDRFDDGGRIYFDDVGIYRLNVAE